MYNEEAISKVSDKLSITRDEIVHALEIADQYRAARASLKAWRRELKRSAKILQRELEEPERCFCQEKGLKPPRDWDNDPIIRVEQWPNFSMLGAWLPGSSSMPIRRCQVCGKGYAELIAIA